MTEFYEDVATTLGVTDLRPLRPGGQKRVFAAKRGAEDVVLKAVEVLPPNQAVVLERAKREVALLAKVSNAAGRRIVALRSGLATVGDPAQPSAVGWLEEMIDGQDLLDLITGNQWPQEEALDLILGLARALTHLHDDEVVHRDLSPGNVRRRSDGTWTLLDPGLARHLAEMSLTGLYQPGTAGFRSPEQVPGGTPDTFSDIYGVGILGFVVLTGRYPIDPSGAEDEYFRRLVQQQPAPVKTLRPDLDDAFAMIIDCCLNRQPARRYLDAAELLEALDEVTTGTAQ
ncbi:serine/threonine protein kinase [Nocardia abscessus]|uniref:non-specific serine/threonine protein kinase n=1 Tax=Nocardia abscessus TaxID=120957 RepID=A0ABS0C6Q2_9NOCA|nr:serine/threonine-protein kinase [Nocardia abscessus]MBF6226035.1 serine/threonine protein kinase [Nocardia abscessus]